MKAALVDTSTGIVSNVIVVDTLDDAVADGFVLAPMEYTEVDAVTGEEAALIDILSRIDPNYVKAAPKLIETPVHPGITKWSVDRKFYQE